MPCVIILNHMLNRITNFEHWQAKLGQNGELAEGFDDIHQGIQLVILTPLGSIPGLPEFGINHDLFRDLEQLGAAREASVHLHERLSFWCERIEVESVDVDHIEANIVRFAVVYTLADDVSGQVFTFEFDEEFGGF